MRQIEWKIDRPLLIVIVDDDDDDAELIINPGRIWSAIDSNSYANMQNLKPQCLISQLFHILFDVIQSWVF